MQNKIDQEYVLEEAAKNVVRMVAESFVGGGGDKSARQRIKEELRDIWHAGSRAHSYEMLANLNTLIATMRKADGI